MLAIMFSMRGMLLVNYWRGRRAKHIFCIFAGGMRRCLFAAAPGSEDGVAELF